MNEGVGDAMPGAYIEEYYGAATGALLASRVIGNGHPSLLFFFASGDTYSEEKDRVLKDLYTRGKFLLSTYKLDYEKEEDLKRRFGVTTEDTVVLVDGEGKAKQSIVGATEDDLRLLLSSSLTGE